MNLPIDWCRINQFPEWFSIEKDAHYHVLDVEKDTETHFTGEQLKKGLEIKLSAGTEKNMIIR
ncbi:hypothetical protein ACFL02_06235 [Planctomycetota bacterium]